MTNHQTPPNIKGCGFAESQKSADERPDMFVLAVKIEICSITLGGTLSKAGRDYRWQRINSPVYGSLVTHGVTLSLDILATGSVGFHDNCSDSGRHYQ
jgi:hypothetical protein